MAATGADAPGQNSAYRPPWRIEGRIIIDTDSAGDFPLAHIGRRRRAGRVWGFVRRVAVDLGGVRR